MKPILTEQEENQLLSGCEHDGAYIPVSDVRRLIKLSAQKGYEKSERRISTLANRIKCDNKERTKELFTCSICKKEDTLMLVKPKRYCSYCLKNELEKAKQEGRNEVLGKIPTSRACDCPCCEAVKKLKEQGVK